MSWDPNIRKIASTKSLNKQGLCDNPCTFDAEQLHFWRRKRARMMVKHRPPVKLFINVDHLIRLTAVSMGCWFDMDQLDKDEQYLLNELATPDTKHITGYGFV